MEGHFGTIDVAFSRCGEGVMFCLFVCLVNWSYWIYSVYNCKCVCCSMGAVLPANKVNIILSYLINGIHKYHLFLHVWYKCAIAMHFTWHWEDTNIRNAMCSQPEPEVLRRNFIFFGKFLWSRLMICVLSFSSVLFLMIQASNCKDEKYHILFSILCLFIAALLYRYGLYIMVYILVK